jgi:prepilin-type N-terminal cleavage/methylation domain-containing protein
MSMLWRQIRKRAFTLIELLVVIAIIALLAAILTPAINNALLKGRMTQTIGNGKGLYTLLFSQEMNNPLGLQTQGTAEWPRQGQYANSSLYFATLVTNDAFGISYNFFAASGIPPAKDLSEFTTAQADGKPRNAWCIALDVSDRLPATTPVLFTQNINLSGSALNGAFSLSEMDPFGTRGCVVVQRGGSAFSLDKNSAIGTNFNMTGATNLVLYPAGRTPPT